MRTFGLQRHGPRDPTIRIEDRGLWRATLTPEGPATLRLDVRGHDVEGRAWGRGARWVIDRMDIFVGADDRSSLEPVHPVVHHMRRSMTGVRIGATHRVM